MSGLSSAEYLEIDGRRWNFWTAGEGHYQAATDYLRYRILLGLLPPSCRRVADIGCGDGYLSYLMRQRGHRVIAIDFGASRLRKAWAGQPAGLQAVQASCYSIPLADASVDHAVLSEILEHLDSPLEALREAARIVRPGGRVLVSVPHAQDAPEVVCPHCCRQFNAAGHVQHFDSNSLRGLAEKSGLRPVRSFTAASALSRYLLRRLPWLAPVAVAMDQVLRRLVPADNLHLVLVAACPHRAP
jgi:SAM-dependent methyltransferase